MKMVGGQDSLSIAIWEREVVIIFCDVCLEEIERGNRPISHFNKEGWMSIVKNFTLKTGRNYGRLQLKNKWDQMKKDWKLWKELKRGCTGLGWDSKKKTIAASDDWWTEKLQVNPTAKKFRHAGIDPELEEKMDMFSGVVAAGIDAWAPSEGVVRDSETVHIDSTPVEDTMHITDDVVECSRTNKINPPRKRKRGSDFLREKISILVDACKQVSYETHMTQSNTVQEAVKVLDNIKEVYDDPPLYFFSIKLLEDHVRRLAFLAMSAERRTSYLRYYYEMQ